MASSPFSENDAFGVLLACKKNQKDEWLLFDPLMFKENPSKAINLRSVLDWQKERFEKHYYDKRAGERRTELLSLSSSSSSFSGSSSSTSSTSLPPSSSPSYLRDVSPRAYLLADALAVALWCTDLTPARALLSMGANLNQLDSLGQTPLHIAAGNKVGIFVFLYFFSSSSTISFFSRCPLFLCCREEWR
jgi:hypothetical protein